MYQQHWHGSNQAQQHQGYAYNAPPANAAFAFPGVQHPNVPMGAHTGVHVPGGGNSPVVLMIVPQQGAQGAKPAAKRAPYAFSTSRSHNYETKKPDLSDTNQMQKRKQAQQQQQAAKAAQAKPAATKKTAKAAKTADETQAKTDETKDQPNTDEPTDKTKTEDAKKTEEPKKKDAKKTEDAKKTDSKTDKPEGKEEKKSKCALQ